MRTHEPKTTLTFKRRRYVILSPALLRADRGRSVTAPLDNLDALDDIWAHFDYCRRHFASQVAWTLARSSAQIGAASV
jgi:hypothetical protein